MTPTPKDAADDAPRWFALHTRARHERRVEERLRARGVEGYLPLVERKRQWHDRVKLVPWPLFPGYVFARVPSTRLGEALSVPGVAGVVRTAGRPSEIRPDEIEEVRTVERGLAQSGGAPEPEPLLRQGDRVRVRHGPFAGVRGRVVERRGDRSLIQIGLEAIERGVRLDVAARDLEPLAGGNGDG